MAKTLTEMTAEIVRAAAGVARMSGGELSNALMAVYDSLKAISDREQDLAAEKPEAKPVAIEPKGSIQQNKIICLECGREFKQLSRSHLVSHGLTPREYKKKHGFKPTQALTAKSLSAKRRKVARDRGLGQKLAAARKGRTST
jgi:predicted transcriptional regulator